MGVTECTDLSPRYEQGLTFKVVFTQLSVCYVTVSFNSSGIITVFCKLHD